MKKLFLSAVLGLSSAAASAIPASYLDLGVIGQAGQYTFTSDGSFFTSRIGNVDTELGIWDETGLLLDNDDDGSVGLFSEVSLNLDSGVYFLGMSEFNSYFENDFAILGTRFESFEVGNLQLNINGAFAGSLMAGGEQTNYAENAYFRVEVADVSEPGSLALLALGLAGMNILRKRSK